MQYSPRKPLVCALLLMACASVVGCASDPEWVSVRSAASNPFMQRIGFDKPERPRESPRTAQLLRRYDLKSRLGGDREGVIAELGEQAAPSTWHEHEYAMAELAYLGAVEQKGNKAKALDLYGAALLHSYRYLFDHSDGSPCNPYDPQFRGACDLYNKALEGLLRVVREDGDLRPGDHQTIVTENHVCGFDIELHSSGWHPEDFDRFEFVSDYQVNGLRNHYHTYGLGVPLIAIRRPHEGSHAAEEYYPSRLCFPLTAFLRITEPEAAIGPNADPATPAGSPRFVLELRDPFDQQALVINGRETPLESDLSTPLAYFLNQPELQEQAISTLGLLRPDSVEKLQGLYMLEPYDPKKMPVLMVHGLWSSPITWMEMYNDLRSDPLVRSRYQFWSYLYPTGQPFWMSAAQLRQELADVRQTLDPNRQAPALDQMVLVGHSMGGLVSKLQSVDSGRDFWRINSDRPFEELQADPEVYQKLANAYFFRPNESVRRVVTIGTPHRGSKFANVFTRWLGRTLIDSPMRLARGREQLYARNRGYFHPNSALEIRTSIDSLAPESPLLPAVLNARPGPWVTYHNIVGRKPDSLVGELLGEEGDGVVSLTSAKLDDMPQLASQIVVPSDHVSVHRHPQSVLEVRRILLAQLLELESLPYGPRSEIQLAGGSTIEAVGLPTGGAQPVVGSGGAPPPVRR
ncbi:MAG: alpha/beta fold hydrolase [Planctomycetota bacterium]